MKESLNALLSHAIDYAGLFPPAKLPLENAVPEYERHFKGTENWILSRFVCNVSDLAELALILPPSTKKTPWELVALGTSTAAFEADLDLITEFEQEADDRAHVQVYEVKSGGKLDRHFLTKIEDSEFNAVYVELPWSREMLDEIHHIGEYEGVGVKARTGGLEAASFPSPEQVAEFMKECLDLELPFKLTAGLHHPIRHSNIGVNAKMHGFLNVFVAGALSLSEDLNSVEIAEILADEDPKSFTFKDDSLGWRSLTCDLATIEQFRGFFDTFGSCSIDEPIEDLEKLGLLKTGVEA